MAAESDIDLVLGTNLQGFVAGLGEATSKLSSALESMRVVAKKETNEIDAAFQTLGVRSLASVEAEIKDVERAFDTLKRSGTLSAQEIAVAQNKAQIQIAQLRSETTGWADAFDQVKGKALVAVASLAGVATVLGSAGAAAAEFGREMAAVSTQLDNPNALPQLTEDVRELAREMGGDAPSNAQALYDILSAGVSDPIAAMDRLTVANKLAVGGLTDVSTAAGGLNAVMNSYGESVGSASDVSDSFFVAAREGATSVGELATNVGKVAPLAKQAGVGFDELIASVTALTNGGVGTSEAFTQVQSILTAVVKPTKEAADLAGELGLNFSVAALESKGLAGFLQEVSDKTGGSTEQMAVLFGRVEGLNGALALTGGQAESFGNTIAAMAEKSGAAEKAFKALSETDAFKLQQFASAIKDVQLSLGKAVTSLTPLLGLLTGALDIFNDLPEPIKLVTLGIGALVAALVPLGFAFTALKAPVALLAATALPQLTAALAASAAAAVASAGGAAALLLRFGPLGIAAGALALATSAAADALTEYALAQQQVAAEGEYAELLRKEIVERQAAADALKQYADVAVLSAEKLKTLSADELAAYKERIEGAKEYQSNVTGVIVRQRELHGSTEENTEAARLNAERQKELNAGLEALAAATAKATEKAPTLLQKLIELTESFKGSGEASEATAKAFEKLFSDTDWSKSEEIDALAKGLGRVAEYASLADQDLRNGLTKSLEELSGAQLQALAESARKAFQAGTTSAEGMNAVLDGILAASLGELGASADLIGIKFTEAGSAAIATFTAAAATGRGSADQIAGAFSLALSKLSTAEEIKALIDELKKIGPASGLSLGQMEKAAADAAKALDKVTSASQKLSEEARLSSVRELEDKLGRLLVVAGEGGDVGGEIAKVRTRLSELNEAGKKAAEGTKQATEETKKTGDSAGYADSALQGFGAAADQAGASAERLAGASGEVSAGLDGIAAAASHAGKAYETASNLGEKLTQAFLSGGGGDFGNYQQFFFQNLEFVAAAAEEGNKAVAEAVRLAELADPQLQRERQIREQLIGQYQVGGAELEKLVQIRLKELEATQQQTGAEDKLRESIQATASAVGGSNTILRKFEIELKVTNAQTGGAQPLTLTDTQIRDIADRVITVIQRDQNA